jgi:hypothetical protein
VSTPPTGAALELPLVAAAPASTEKRSVAGVSRDEWLRLAHRAKVLSWVSLAYMTFEGTVAIVAGVVAGSVALIGFGIDSAIEGFASLVIVWRFTGHRLLSEHAERRAQRLVAIQFFLLAPFITVEALKALIAGEHPDVSPSASRCRSPRSPSCRISGGPSSASARPWARSPPRARASRTCSAPTSQRRCWWAWPATPPSACGGWTPPSVC